MRVFILFFILIFSIISADVWLWFHHYLLPNPIYADAVGFYSYLPSTFIYHDWDMNFINPHYSFCLSETGHVFLRNPMGVALMQAPFFFVAHGLTLIQSLYPPDGYSAFYQIALYVSALFYSVVGTFFTYKILKEKFSENITILSLCAIIFGCGVFFYSTLHCGYSHIYSFCLISIFIYLTIKNKNPFMIGFLLGLIFLVRNINSLIILFYLFYDKENFKKIIPLMIGFILPLIPQMIYWKIQTGHFLINSYDLKYQRLICKTNPQYCFYDHFDFLKPHILNNFFSYKKGLFFYYPALIYAVFGLFYIEKKFKYSIIIFLLPIIYLISSWSDWSYGFSFGQRPYVDYMSIFALLIATTLFKIKRKNISYSVLIFLTLYSLLMMILVMAGFCTNDGSLIFTRF